MAQLILNDGRTYDVPEVSGSWVDGVDGHVLVLPANLALSIGMMVSRWGGQPADLEVVRVFAYRTTDDAEKVVADLRAAMAGDAETIAKARAVLVQEAEDGA
jgi:hypothetical protein